jgi:hypothetical protein
VSPGGLIPSEVPTRNLGFVANVDGTATLRDRWEDAWDLVSKARERGISAECAYVEHVWLKGTSLR